MNIINQIIEAIKNNTKPEDMIITDLSEYAYGVLLLSFVGFWSFCNILGYIISIYILEKNNLESRFPKISLYFKQYKLLGTLDIIISCIFLLWIFFVLIISSLFLIICSWAR